MPASATACSSRARPAAWLGLAALVYMLPLVLFFIGYAIGNAAGGGAAGALAGGMLFALGIIGAIFYSRRMKQNGEVPFEITHRL